MLNLDIYQPLIPEPLQFTGAFSAPITGLVGPSGCGKTTLLKIMAGLITPKNGKIMADAVTWLDTKEKTSLSPQQRHIGFVFQDLALFPNLTCQENIQFSAKLKQNQIPEFQQDADERFEQLITRLRLKPFLNQRPHQLSGGQKQRVALARALFLKPSYLFLDEPFNGLDDALRAETMTLTKTLIDTYQMQTILVSHRQSDITEFTTTLIHLPERRPFN